MLKKCKLLEVTLTHSNVILATGDTRERRYCQPAAGTEVERWQEHDHTAQVRIQKGHPTIRALKSI